MTDDEAKVAAQVQLNAQRVAYSAETQEMLEDLSIRFCSVWLCVGGTLIDERHVADPVTIQTTVKMSAERLNARTAAYPIADEIDGSAWWEVMRYRDLTSRRYPTEEAAKMVALHLG